MKESRGITYWIYTVDKNLFYTQYETMNEEIHHTAQVEIYRTIQERIRKGFYEPGQKISENKLAKEFNCSRTPVRETIKTLEKNGLVTVLPKSGSYVRKYTDEEIKNALEVRAYLEACAYMLLIEKNIDISPLEETVNKMKEIGNEENFNIEQFGLLDYNFHTSLVSLSNNPFLINIYNGLHLINIHNVFYKKLTKEDIELTNKEHEELLKLIKNKDLSGREYIINHLLRRRNDYITKDDE